MRLTDGWLKNAQELDFNDVLTLKPDRIGGSVVLAGGAGPMPEKPPQNACPQGGQGQTITASELDRKAILRELRSVKKQFQSYVEKKAFYIVHLLPGPCGGLAPVSPGRRPQSDSRRGDGWIPARPERESSGDV
jgi:hypothetical protein